MYFFGGGEPLISNPRLFLVNVLTL